MSGFRSTGLSDPRLAAHALSPLPAWLWSADASRILWANPTGAAIFHADSPAALEALRFDRKQPSAAQIARLAGTLPPSGTPRLERLRGFGASIGGTLTCQCSRIALADNTGAILVAATERAGPDFPLDERLRRLMNGMDEAVAAFSADGELLQASPAARQRLGTAADLMALGAEMLAQQASRNGQAEGETSAGRATLNRLGAGGTMVLFLAFAPSRADNVASTAPVAPTPSAAKPPATPSVDAAAPPATAKRRYPLRFVWQMDAATRFTLESDEFIRLIGAKTAAALGRPWKEIAAELDLDPDGQIAGALGSRDTWSAILVRWPVDGGGARLPVELSGLPVFDRDRSFQGYRGFGVCRDTDRLSELAQRRTETAAKREPEPSATVLPFPTPALSPREHSAFRELARELSDRLKTGGDKPTPDDDFGPEQPAPIAAPHTDAPRAAQTDRPILDRLPIGILIYRLNDLIYANRAFLDWTGYATLEALSAAGGLDSLFIETNVEPAGKTGGKNGARSLTITTLAGQQLPVEGRLFSVVWDGDNALVLMLNTAPAGDRSKAADKTAEMTLRRIEAENRELNTVLDTATDGVVLVDRSGRVVSANRSAEALFGFEPSDFTDLSFGDLFAPESRRVVLGYLDRLARGGTAALINEGKEVVGRVRRGGLIPLSMTIGQIGEAGEKFCAVFRDITAWKKTEEELINARHQAEITSAAKSDFLAKISHEIRTPLNAIIGFSEVMMDERFGPIGNERYRQYLRDIHASGGQLIALLNDLLDLSKIETGKLDLTFTNVNLNDVTQQCVAIMQQQANRDHVIIRTSLPPSLPQIVADARSVRQIVLNLLSSSIKLTGAGGQVIVSTALTDDQEVVLRVRDTGTGMSEQELQTALEPFRQLATAVRWGASGTGLGLPITKALAEANHASFKITSAVSDGTLVEVAFPATRVLAQ